MSVANRSTTSRANESFTGKKPTPTKLTAGPIRPLMAVESARWPSLAPKQMRQPPNARKNRQAASNAPDAPSATASVYLKATIYVSIPQAEVQRHAFFQFHPRSEENTSELPSI